MEVEVEASRRCPSSARMCAEPSPAASCSRSEQIAQNRHVTSLCTTRARPRAMSKSPRSQATALNPLYVFTTPAAHFGCASVPAYRISTSSNTATRLVTANPSFSNSRMLGALCSPMRATSRARGMPSAVVGLVAYDRRSCSAVYARPFRPNAGSRSASAITARVG